MPGDNCSILGCPVSRSRKYKGIGIYKVPSGDSEWETKWREKLVAIVTRDRVVDSALKEKIANKRLFICQRHYHPDQINVNDTRSSVKPGEIPTLNLPIKSFQSPPSTPRSSSISAASKRLTYQSSTITSPPSHCYKSFEEFKKRCENLKLKGWSQTSTSSVFTASFMDGIHLVPKFEIFVTENLDFIVRVFAWRLPPEHSVFSDNLHSFQNIHLSNFISILNSFIICPGITVEDSSSLNHGFIHHVIPKIFSPSNVDTSFPLFQTKFFRAESCHLLISKTLSLCSSCSSHFKKESFSLKRKSENLAQPAKLHAPIMATAPEKVKLTLQSYRIQNKQLKCEIEEMKALIHSNNITVNKELNDDLQQIKKRKPFLAPYHSVSDERFDWLIKTFLPYFVNWKKSITDREGDFNDHDRARMFISWQTYESIQITTYSSIDLIKYLIQNGVKYVYTEHFCQDPLENYFGRQRQAGRRHDNPSVQQFGYIDNTLRVNKSYRPLASGNSRDTSTDTFTISTEPLPCRPRKNKSKKKETS